MIDVLGKRQQQLLRVLLKNKNGMTIDQLTQALAITRTAVRQHLTALEKDGLISLGESRASGGRPEQLYVLSDKGKELFPRHYSWIAELVIDAVKQESGAEQHRERLKKIGNNIGENLRKQHPDLMNSEQRVAKLAELMEQLGYDAIHLKNIDTDTSNNYIEADNCVFHNLAAKDPDICEFDLALLATFTGNTVEHQACMATGGNVCRFKFLPKASQ